MQGRVALFALGASKGRPIVLNQTLDIPLRFGLHHKMFQKTGEERIVHALSSLARGDKPRQRVNDNYCPNSKIWIWAGRRPCTL